jgi:hypothetical protein
MNHIYVLTENCFFVAVSGRFLPERGQRFRQLAKAIATARELRGSFNNDLQTDAPEDWVLAQGLALNKIKWECGQMTIIYIAHAPPHGSA